MLCLVQNNDVRRTDNTKKESLLAQGLTISRGGDLFTPCMECAKRRHYFLLLWQTFCFSHPRRKVLYKTSGSKKLNFLHRGT